MAQISTTKCDLCERDTGKLFCYECRQFLCQSCKNIHDKIQKRHTVTESHNVDKLALSEQLTCEEHKEDFVHYCSSCECLICSSCVTTVHQGHSLTHISAAVSKARENVKLNIVKLKTKMKTLTTLIEPIKATKFKEIKDDSEHFSSDVTTTSEHIISIVNSVKEIHITRASDFLVSEKQQLEFTIAKLEKVYNEHASVSSQLEQVLQLKHDIAFFLNQRTITKQIGDLDEIPRIEELNEIGKFNKEEFAESVVEQIKSQYNKGQENTNTNLERQLISAIHKQIGCERTGDDNITLLTDINKEIQKSIKTLCEKRGHDIEASQIPPKGADKIKKGQASATPMRFDLRTAVDSTISNESIMKANKDLLTYRKELKEISDQVKNMVELQGFQPDIRKGDKDTPGAEVKETLLQIQQRNRVLSQQLKLLDKAVISCKIGMELQQDKSAVAKSKTEIRKTNKESKKEETTKSSDKSDLSTIERAVKSVEELQGYKSKMDSLALRVIFLSNQKKNEKQDTISLSHFEQAIMDIEDLNKKHQKTTGTERQPEEQIKLSKIAGHKLTEGNPDITNLGDPNRPMKLGEWFSELYDNEWTDVMDLCLKKLGKKFDEDTILQALYKTLMSCYMICKDNSTKSLAKARKHFQDASKELMINTQEDEIIKLVIDNRKSAADSASKQLLKEIQDGNYPDAKKLLKDIDEKVLSVIQPTPFFSQCLTLCWKMVVQNQPLVLQGGPPQGREFDRNEFREYTSSGTKVVFTVWPALYLHENGLLLVKGVVKVK